MSQFKITRRQLVLGSAAIAAVTALGLDGRRAQAEGAPLRSRYNEDIQVLDPGYMIGGAETTMQFATLPRLANPVKDASGTWTWAPVRLCQRSQADRRRQHRLHAQAGLHVERRLRRS